ncbi:hypothetical protein Tco_1376204 [Tanacetum coccineum]
MDMTFEQRSSSLDRQCQMMYDHNSSDLAPQRQEMSVENVSSGLVPQGQKASDYDNSDRPQDKIVPSAGKTVRHNKVEFLLQSLLEGMITIQHTVKLRKTTMIKHRMHPPRVPGMRTFQLSDVQLGFTNSKLSTLFRNSEKHNMDQLSTPWYTIG